MRSDVVETGALAVLRHGRDRPAWWVTGLALIGGVISGILVVLSPLAAAGPLAIATLALLAAKRRVVVSVFVTSVFLLVIGYIFMGRGFAYLGIAPIYIGEMVLCLGAVAYVIGTPRRAFGAPQLLICLFMAIGALGTVPYLALHGFDALRDAASWGYALFALLISVLLRGRDLVRMVGAYGRLVPLIVIWVPVLGAAWYVARPIFPTGPGGVEIPYFKPGDMAVHLAGAGAFVLTGLYPRTSLRRMAEPILWATWIAGFTVVAALNRGGMLAAAVAMAMMLGFVRSFARWFVVIMTGLILLTLVITVDLEIDAGRDRVLSAGQIIENVESVIGESDDRGLAGTREWREQWWSDIVDYTLNGQYFWTGKGYGVNLAAVDGFLGTEFPDLRAPHNAHLQFLARGGLPGFVSWLLVLTAFFAVMVASARRCAVAGWRGWQALHAWILAYWIAAVINMSFDVYLEGPQGGIVFWSLTGIGLAISAMARRAATDLPVLAESAPEERETGGLRSPR